MVSFSNEAFVSSSRDLGIACSESTPVELLLGGQILLREEDIMCLDPSPFGMWTGTTSLFGKLSMLVDFIHRLQSVSKYLNIFGGHSPRPPHGAWLCVQCLSRPTINFLIFIVYTHIMCMQFSCIHVGGG